jgi:uncharacterized membrane protein (DUF485 family)
LSAAPDDGIDNTKVHGMPGFASPPETAPQQEDEVADARNTRYGLILFSIYLAVYAGFVLLNAFWPELMDRVPFAGLNLAVLYGFGLIVVALVLAALYGWLCHKGPK